MERAELREFVRKHRKQGTSFLERKLWGIAEQAPLGGMVIGSDVNPYLLRVYVSPREPEFKWIWKKTQAYLTEMGEYESTIFQGIPHLYLHHFFRGDTDRELHDHPWLFSMSLILTGGYVEERWDPNAKVVRVRHFYPGDVNVIRNADFHRIILKTPEQGCWTVFLSSNRIEAKNGHDWGFLDTATGVYTPWGPFLEKKQQPES